MKLRNKIMLCCIFSLLCLSIFSACQKDDDYVSQATNLTASSSEATSEESSENNTENNGQTVDPKVAQDLRDGADNLQPGAKTEDSVDENGNQTFTYSNPDGTGGGGAVIN